MSPEVQAIGFRDQHQQPMGPRTLTDLWNPVDEPEEHPPVPPDPTTQICPEGYVYTLESGACEWNPTAPEFVNYWYCLQYPGSPSSPGGVDGPFWMSVPSNRTPASWWYVITGTNPPGPASGFVPFNFAPFSGPAPECG